MGLDLTGGNLIAYVLRVIKDIAARSPRFKNSYGEVSFATNNTLSFGDVQVMVRNISASGNRLSPDYFMYTQVSRALAAKVTDKDGVFVEWINEISNLASGYTPGVYYMNIDSLDESMRQVGMTLAQYQWFEGQYRNAAGSIIYFGGNIEASTVVLSDAANPNAIINSAVYGTYLVLLSPVTTLVIKNAQGETLTPLTDYWYQRSVSQVLVQSTLGGVQDVTIPTLFATQYTITDQDDYTLRPGGDYYVSGLNQITLSQWTPTGSTLTITGTVILDPSTNSPINPENYLSFTLAPGQTIAEGQVIVYASSGDYYTLAEVDGQYMLPTLLAPGDWMNWEVRVSCGQFKTFVNKLELNNLWWWQAVPAGIALPGTNASGDIQSYTVTMQSGTLVYSPIAGTPSPTYIMDSATGITYQLSVQEGNVIYAPVTSVTGAYYLYIQDSVTQTVYQVGMVSGQILYTPITTTITEVLDGATAVWVPYRNSTGALVNLIPGVQVAVGDQVVVNDQAAIIVSPYPSQTYQVYGSKELVSFTLDVKANDLMTASELSEIIRRELLVTRRTTMEADGVSVQEASRDSQGEQRDSSGTATRYTYSLNVSALCDWKMFVPLVTRVTAFDITETAELPDYQGKLSAAPRVQAFGAQRFVAFYTFVPSYY
jgi:hypothetical protein